MTTQVKTAFDEEEQRLLNHSFGSGHQVRRMRGVLLGALVPLAMLGLFPVLGFGFKLLEAFVVVLVAVSVLEKYLYNRTMLAYESLIRKLAHRVELADGIPLTAEDGNSLLTEQGRIQSGAKLAS